MATKTGTGFSKNDDTSKAVNEAVGESLKNLGSSNPDFFILFGTLDYNPERLAFDVQKAAGSSPVFGGLSNGIFIYGEDSQKKGIAVMAVQSDEISCSHSEISKIGKNPENACRKVLDELESYPVEENKSVLLMLIATYLENHSLADLIGIIGNEKVPGSVIVGGGAMNLDDATYPTLLSKGAMLADAIGVMQFVSSGPVGIGISHGYDPIGELLIVTKSRENVIYTLNGKTAFDIYKNQFADSMEITRENFYQVSVDYPLGLPQVNREYIIRDPVIVGDDGSIICGGEIPSNSVMRIMRGNSDSMIHAAEKAAKTALAELNGKKPVLCLIFDCTTRVQYLGNDISRELDAVRSVIGKDVPFIGLSSFGEIAAEKNSPPALHNKTIVIGLFGES